MFQFSSINESDLVTYTGQDAMMAIQKFISENYLNVTSSSQYTGEGYRIEVVNKILAAKRSKKVSIPSDEKGFLAWLKAKRV